MPQWFRVHTPRTFPVHGASRAAVFTAVRTQQHWCHPGTHQESRPPDLPNQGLWGWGLGSLHVTSPAGDSDPLQALRSLIQCDCLVLTGGMARDGPLCPPEGSKGQRMAWNGREHPAGSGQRRPRPRANMALRGEGTPRVEPDYSWVPGHAGDAGCGCPRGSRSLNEKNNNEDLKRRPNWTEVSAHQAELSSD